MEDLIVTRLWMLGVIAIMAVYGLVAVVGLKKSSVRTGDDSTNEDSDGVST